MQTGWGRTGEHFWGYQSHGLVPDMLTFAKGVGNGLALAGVVARAEVMDTIQATSFSTFGGNPLSTAGGLATLQAVLDEDMQGNALRMGQRIVDRLGPVASATPWIAELRGKGLMLALETIQGEGIDPDAGRAATLLEACKERGLLIGKGGLYGNVLRIAPMLNTPEAEVDEGLDALVDAIASVD